MLADHHVLVALARHLGQVGDHHDLGGFTELAQQTTDHGRRRAADPHIHFIKDQGRRRNLAGADHYDGEADARQLTTGGDLAERLDRLTRVGGDHKLHPINAEGGETALGIGPDLDGEATIGHGQLVHAAGHLGA
ncbi:hypothetical protein D3C79_745920 [compost metagenome]